MDSFISKNDYPMKFFCVCDLTVLEPKLDLSFLLASHQEN